jgi:hypothetical protein
LPNVAFPTQEHATMSQLVVEYASRFNNVDTVLVVNSCARARAVPESDLDMAILIEGDFDEAALEAEWEAHMSTDPDIQKFWNRGPHSAIHLDFFNGEFESALWDDGGGPDDFEIEIGNRIVHSVPLGSPGPLLDALRDRWLPYYQEPLRQSRFSMVREACLNDSGSVPFYFSRDLYLQAFDRLYKAFREYLQALFIAHRTYPIAYNKWLQEQLEMIGRSDLFDSLMSVLSISDLKSRDLIDRAVALRELAIQLEEQPTDGATES